MQRFLSIILLALVITCHFQLHAQSQVLNDGFIPSSPGIGASPQNKPGDRVRYFQIYLPDGYNKRKNKHYPVIYFLHGFGQNYSSYSGMFEYLDREIDNGTLEPVIVVKPDGSLSDGWLGGFFVNSSLNGHFEDYIVNELRTYVNSHYRTKISKEFTQIAGHAMGGYAALLLGIKHSDIYSTITAHSPSTIIAMSPQVYNPNFYNSILQEIPLTGPSAGKILPTNGRNSYQLFALSAALSPNLAHQPFLLDLPIHVNPDFTPILLHGKLQPNPFVLQKWLQNDPYTLIETNLQRQQWLESQQLYIDFGIEEELIDKEGFLLFRRLLVHNLHLTFKIKRYKGSSFAKSTPYSLSHDALKSLVQPMLQQTNSCIAPPYSSPITIDPQLYSIDSDGFKNCGSNLSNDCPRFLFQSFTKDNR